jgi:D-tyrosyl-tRNA(Tyr) deacylase
MRAVVQRVSRAKVTVAGEVTGEIGVGLLLLLGVGREDSEPNADYLAEKIVGLRIFDDDGGKMNRSAVDVGGAVLVVSQFTLYGDARKGKRPSFDDAAPPQRAGNYTNISWKNPRGRPSLRDRTISGDDGGGTGK